jgi:hypothetical protein
MGNVFVGERLIIGLILAQGPMILQREDTAVVDVTISFRCQVPQRTFLHIRHIAADICILNDFKRSENTVPRMQSY